MLFFDLWVEGVALVDFDAVLVALAVAGLSKTVDFAFVAYNLQGTGRKPARRVSGRNICSQYGAVVTQLISTFETDKKVRCLFVFSNPVFQICEIIMVYKKGCIGFPCLQVI